MWVRVWAVVGTGTLDVAVRVRRQRRVRLGRHNPAERREGRVDVDGWALVLFFHECAKEALGVVGGDGVMREEGIGWVVERSRLNGHPREGRRANFLRAKLKSVCQKVAVSWHYTYQAGPRTVRAAS
jgi:hypothetical protein